MELYSSGTTRSSTHDKMDTSIKWSFCYVRTSAGPMHSWSHSTMGSNFETRSPSGPCLTTPEIFNRLTSIGPSVVGCLISHLPSALHGHMDWKFVIFEKLIIKCLKFFFLKPQAFPICMWNKYNDKGTHTNNTESYYFHSYNT